MAAIEDIGSIENTVIIPEEQSEASIRIVKTPLPIEIREVSDATDEIPAQGVLPQEIISQRASKAIHRLSEKPGPYIPPQLTKSQLQVRAAAERAEAERLQLIKDQITSIFGKYIKEVLDLQELKAGTDALQELRFSTKNEPLLSALVEYGYISPEMHEEGQLDIKGLVAARLLLVKDMSKSQELLLTGAHSVFVRQVVDDDIEERAKRKFLAG
jgi:hypothetical protein